MATYTQIRGNNQIKDTTIDLTRLQSPFLSSSTGNWDVTSGNLDATITGIPDPVNTYDVANKHYVDSLFAGGLSWKAPVRVLSTSNIDISNPPSEIDGVTLQSGDRIALFNQATSTEDGVYVYNETSLERAEDWPEGANAGNWTFWVQEGNTYADTQWTVTNDKGSDVIGTDDLIIVQIAGQGTYIFQNALEKTGNIVELGGELTKNTSIVGNSSYSFTFNSLKSMYIGTSTNTYINITENSQHIYGGDSNGDGFIDLWSGGLDIGIHKDSDEIKLTFVYGISIKDTHNNKGAYYADDYHENFTNRSIVDKQYIDTFDKLVVKARAIGNIDISNPPSEIDGVALNSGDLILLDQQTTVTEDGIYVYNGSGNALTRAPYFENGVDIKGLGIFVEEGDIYGKTYFIVSNTNDTIIGTDDIQVTTIGGVNALLFDNGLTLTGNEVKWGGSLKENTEIDSTGSYNISFINSPNFLISSGSDTSSSNAYFEFTENSLELYLKNTSQIFDIKLDNSSISILANNPSTGSESGLSYIIGNGLLVKDEIYKYGLRYNSDYKDNNIGTSFNPRWIPDLAYVTTMDRVYVRVKSTANIDISNPPSAIDGVNLNNGDLILLTDQTTATEDGIYVYNGTGNPLSRAPYFPSGTDVKGLLIYVEEGTNAANTLFAVSNDGEAILGTNDIEVQAIGGATVHANANNGLHVDNGVIKLGGTLTEETTIDVTNHQLRYYIGTGNAVTGKVVYRFSAGSGALVHRISPTDFGGRISTSSGWFGYIFDGANGITKIGFGSSGNSSDLDFTTTKGFEITNSDFTIIDSTSSFGIKYADDYSTNGLSDDRWIPDLGTVRSLITNATNRYYNEVHEISSDTNSITLNNANSGDGKAVSNEEVYVNGIRQAPGSTYDYTIDTDTGVITFNYTLNAGDIVVVDYNYA